MAALGDLPGGGFGSSASDVSADGAVVVGQGTTALGAEAFVWEADTGMQRLADVLAGAGVDLAGWTLTSATGVSADGTTIVGTGLNAEGQVEAWRARLVDPPACANGLDDDGDGLTDWPADPGCPFASAGPEDPPCDDGLDNDGDGLTDFDDPDCQPEWPYWESVPSCGLGAELALLAPIIARSLRANRR
jgi:hypothetical protein